jgi:signal transduction histidine kinase
MVQAWPGNLGALVLGPLTGALGEFCRHLRDESRRLADERGALQGEIARRRQMEGDFVKAQEYLEQKVRERTTELALANERLQREMKRREIVEEELLNQEKLESHRALAGGIAHDFQTIVETLSRIIHQSQSYLNPTDKAYDALKKSEGTLDTAQELILQLLTLASEVPPAKETTSLAALIAGPVEGVLKRSGITCQCLLPADLWPVEADPVQIRQVLEHLLLYAGQELPKDGVITLSGQNIAIEQASVQLPKDKKFVKISIKGAGAGISAERLKKMFDPYALPRQRGNGLGLALAHSIIKKHGGYLTAESRPGAGTTFHIYLPA